MSQPSVASFFNTRKRAGADDVAGIKSRRITQDDNTITTSPCAAESFQQHDDNVSLKASAITGTTMCTRSGRAVKRIGKLQSTEGFSKKLSKVEQTIRQQQQPKLVQFIVKGSMSPRKKASINEVQKMNEKTPSTHDKTTNTILDKAFSSKNNATNVERGLKTPTKQIIKGSGSTPLKRVGGGELKNLVKKELKFDEVKTKISRSSKLLELKASLERIQELEKTRKAQEKRNRRLSEGPNISPVKTSLLQLKEFDTIELEVLTSPSKIFKTPTKLPPPTPNKNELMSPRHTDVSKRVLFSPAKNGSPSKMIVPPAYQRFKGLVEISKAGQLSLPYKYRHLIEIFKGVDSVCAMFHNRRECITFKKLKPAVQRMLRKNFSETHLAQIKHLYPDAFLYTQMKMRNYGSTSKADYFQLVISPNVGNSASLLKQPVLNKNDADNVLAAAQATTMNPQVMTERLQRFQNILLQRVMSEHDKFLKSLNPPLLISRNKITRWHPDFDLENCPEIECAHLPQPPNVEKYSSAHDILSTARNLFNCATPMERALEHYEAKIAADRVAAGNLKDAEQLETEIVKEEQVEIIIKKSDSIVKLAAAATPTTTDGPTPVGTPIMATNYVTTSALLKGVPKSLLEKIRAKQAAKALDAMTRRPSQDQEATKYSRLPDLARHLRNVFITERKGVLTLEVIINKIQNSFRACLTAQEVEAHLKLIAKEVPTWIAFHEVRKTIYLKIAKDMDLTTVVKILETVANEKSK